MPVIVITEFLPPDVGVKEVTVGVSEVNRALVAVPYGVVTDTLPVVPMPKTAVILVLETTLKELAGVPPNFTLDAPPRLLPVMVITEPS